MSGIKFTKPAIAFLTFVTLGFLGSIAGVVLVLTGSLG